jgi:AcrR family transcriptional regulator
MGVQLPRETDRRVQRTRRALRAALVTLIHERGWDGFSVQDVCDRADVGRSTFYTHYADKEELLAGGFADLRQALRALAASGGPAEPLAFTRGLFDHAFEERRLFLAVVGKKSGQLVQMGFRDLVLGLVREDLGHLPAGPRRDALAAFVGGALVQLLQWALESRVPAGPEEADALFRELVAPVLAAAPPPTRPLTPALSPAPRGRGRERGR